MYALSESMKRNYVSQWQTKNKHKIWMTIIKLDQISLDKNNQQQESLVLNGYSTIYYKIFLLI